MFRMNKILLIMIVLLIFNGCAKKEIHVYSGTPCEGKVFTTSNETILLQHEPYYPSRIQYGYSLYDLEDYAEYRKDRGITFRRTIDENYETSNNYTKEIKLYPIGSSFKVVAFYRYMSTSFEDDKSLSYYLVESLDDHQIIWLYFYDFNSETCNMNLDKEDVYDSENRYLESLILKSYAGVSVNNGYDMPDEFSEDEDLYTVSREYKKNILLKQQENERGRDKK